jgi:hypothetical protein
MRMKNAEHRWTQQDIPAQEGRLARFSFALE